MNRWADLNIPQFLNCFDSTLQEQVEAFVVQSTNKNVIAYAAFLESGD